MTSGSRSAKYADDYLAAHEEFVQLVESLSDAQWRLGGKNFPERTNDEDENRSVGVIAYHVAEGERFIIGRIEMMLRGEALKPLNFPDLNARQAAEHSTVTRDEVLAILRTNAETIVPIVRAIPDDALDVVHETPAGPATIAQRLERVLIGHTKVHQGSIQAALTRQ